MHLFVFVLYAIGGLMVMFSCVVGMVTGRVVAKRQGGTIVSAKWANTGSLLHLLAFVSSAALLVKDVALPDRQVPLAYITIAGAALSFILAQLSANRMYTALAGKALLVFNFARCVIAMPVFMSLLLKLA